MNQTTQEYDLAISFAGENREIAEEIADAISSRGYSVFYDNYERAKLWVEDLSVVLGRIYGEASKFCLIIISKQYVQKPWTNHERQFALSRALNERQSYILPLKLDDTNLPGMSPLIGYLDLRNSSIQEVCNLLQQKLGNSLSTAREDLAGKVAHYSDKPIRDVLSACYRRAVFTRYHAQLDHDAMFNSLSECRSQLQRLVSYVEPEAQQSLVAGIIAELDLIERCNKEEFTWNGIGTMGMIDGAKLRIIHSLGTLSKNAGVSFVMPTSITEEIFFGREEADSPPEGHETDEYWVYGGGGFKG